MSHHFMIIFIFLLLIPFSHSTSRNINNLRFDDDIEPVHNALEGITRAIEWSRAFPSLQGSSARETDLAIADCIKLYEDSRPRIASLTLFSDRDDALTWLSAALASHRTCLDGFEENLRLLVEKTVMGNNLTSALEKALEFCESRAKWKGVKTRPGSDRDKGILSTWNFATSKADIVVAKDGSGDYITINMALATLAIMSRNISSTTRLVVHVKAGVYNEKVEINSNMRNIMFVGDGMDLTIITGNRNFNDGATTITSATFGVSGDGFWARDMTFENTAGPTKYQAVALRVESDLAVFYRCSIKGYQDTLFTHSLRQFYRDCHIYGTIDFIFGNSATVFQNCDILLRKPLDNQENVITAQGRDNPIENTGISILNSRVRPSLEFMPFQARFKSYLGRPWKMYSRTVFVKTYMDGVIDPRGWTEWIGNFGLSTLYYGEYMNIGNGSNTLGRVKWPGYHVIKDDKQASFFDVKNFINGDSWIPATGVPFSSEI
ncbi:pectinesterase-like [Impatiens glandulifera]|uniref:pectinesterase-like n=1 Tax=Impatiens glandulifera TaxID=253017 RepID=UPI001FB14650|nr:pectinesterase-like [Impatiens glandulifera]